MSKIKKNFIYNSIYNFINIIVPFLMLPYITRVLQKENIGINSYINSLTQYFLFLSVLGISLYGTREISYVKNNKEKLNNTFIDLYLMKLCSTIITFILYLYFIEYQNQNIKSLCYIYSLSFLTSLLDVTWFFQGIEDFKKISLRNIALKIGTLVGVFLFVKSSKDLNIYIFINIIGNILGQLVMYYYIFKIINIKIYKFNLQRILKHLKQNIKLFVLQIAIQIYIYLDKVMLGYFGQYIQAGFYDIAQQIIKVGLVVNSTLSTVMLPRISSLIAEKRYEEVKNKIEYSLEIMISLSFPIIFGLLSIKAEFVEWFFGKEYLDVSNLIGILSIILFIIPIGNILGVQLMIPLGKELLVSLSPILGAFINIILNFYLIPSYSAVGASVATIIAEFVGTILTCYFMRKWIDIIKIILKTNKSLIASILMYLLLKSLKIDIKIIPLLLVIKILSGMIFYIIIIIIIKEKNILVVLKNIRRRI